MGDAVDTRTHLATDWLLPIGEIDIYKVLGQKFPYTQVQLPMMPSLNLLDPHNHNLESLSSWHTS